MAVISVLLVVSIAFGVIGGRIAPQADLLGSIAAPFQSLGSKISNGISDFVSAYTKGDEIMLENAALEEELAKLREQLAEYEQAISKNEFYENYLEIKDQNPDFKFCAATLISRDPDDPYGGFTIGKGSLSGVSKNDPVITDAGLVGYITGVGLTTSKVTTILSPDLTLGALGNRTNDSGIVSGTLELASKGLCKFYNLSRSCTVTIGDYVISSGEGIFPSGLLIGTIESIGSDKYNMSIYADVKPFVDIFEIREVMVITEFHGQGGVLPDSGDKK